MKPSRSDEYASDAPSGDHAGSVSRKASCVSRCGAPPTGITHRSPTAANATSFPSGEITGCMIPRTGCGPERSNARRFGVNAGRVNDTSAVSSITRAAPPAAGRRLILPSAV